MSANPKHIGPGYWANWHSNSLRADNREKKTELARNIVTSIDNFPCREPCRKDAIYYIKTHPLIEVVNDNNPLSLFNWTTEFHNYVNNKIGKSTLTLEESKVKLKLKRVKIILKL